MRSLCFGILVFLACPLYAQDTPSDRARAAAEMLDAASADLDAADSARDRVRALTQTISAYEAGLAALRSGMRQSTRREAELSAQLQTRDAEIAALLAVLQRMGDSTSPVNLLHPGGPAGAARAGMLLSDMVPTLNARVEDLRKDYEELRILRDLQDTTSVRLETGLAEVNAARTALSQAIADRTDLPKRFVADPVREAILLSSAQTLEEFAESLDQISSGVAPQALEEMSAQKGALDLPVQGRLLRGAGEADAAGVARPGILIATHPKALVTSPAQATLRYVGPLLDFGQVLILEPEADVLFVLAGLETVYGETGDVIETGAPLGLMGAGTGESPGQFSTDGDETGADFTETLYIEVRENNVAENPSLWFRTDKNG